MKYKCESCGKEHDEWPSLTFNTPDAYHNLSEEEKARIGTISSDFCTITYEDQTDRFIRCTLTQTVNDDCQHLDYGIWVSLSEKSFNDYKENYDNPNREASYFGWFCSMIPQYESTRSIPTTVVTRKEIKDRT